jgi:hypothetical protein
MLGLTLGQLVGQSARRRPGTRRSRRPPSRSPRPRTRSTRARASSRSRARRRRSSRARPTSGSTAARSTAGRRGRSRASRSSTSTTPGSTSSSSAAPRPRSRTRAACGTRARRCTRRSAPPAAARRRSTGSSPRARAGRCPACSTSRTSRLEVGADLRPHLRPARGVHREAVLLHALAEPLDVRREALRVRRLQPGPRQLPRDVPRLVDRPAVGLRDPRALGLDPLVRPRRRRDDLVGRRRAVGRARRGVPALRRRGEGGHRGEAPGARASSPTR